MKKKTLVKTNPDNAAVSEMGAHASTSAVLEVDDRFSETEDVDECSETSLEMAEHAIVEALERNLIDVTAAPTNNWNRSPDAESVVLVVSSDRGLLPPPPASGRTPEFAEFQ